MTAPSLQSLQTGHPEIDPSNDVRSFSLPQNKGCPPRWTKWRPRGHSGSGRQLLQDTIRFLSL